MEKELKYEAVYDEGERRNMMPSWRVVCWDKIFGGPNKAKTGFTVKRFRDDSQGKEEAHALADRLNREDALKR